MPRRLIAAVCALALAPLFAACGDDGDADAAESLTPAISPTSPASASTASPKLSGPAGKYSISLEDIGTAWRTDVRQTFVLDASGYGKTPRLFPNEAEGIGLLKKWGYASGYETAYLPEGLDTAVLNGSYYIMVESHLFNTPEGASQAFEYFTNYLGTSGAQSLPISGVGNKAVAYAISSGKFSGTTATVQYHHVVTLRGNLITAVLTKGAEGLMKLDYARDLALMADEKALGERSAIEPTPTSNYQTPTPGPKP